MKLGSGVLTTFQVSCGTRLAFHYALHLKSRSTYDGYAWLSAHKGCTLARLNGSWKSHRYASTLDARQRIQVRNTVGLTHTPSRNSVASSESSNKHDVSDHHANAPLSAPQEWIDLQASYATMHGSDDLISIIGTFAIKVQHVYMNLMATSSEPSCPPPAFPNRVNAGRAEA